jgi:hypothetical protein
MASTNFVGGESVEGRDDAFGAPANDKRANSIDAPNATTAAADKPAFARAARIRPRRVRLLARERGARSKRSATRRR